MPNIRMSELRAGLASGQITQADVQRLQAAGYGVINDEQQQAPSIADQARASLASRGLTPAQVKAGQGVTTPDQIQFSPDQDPNHSFGAGFVRGVRGMAGEDQSGYPNIGLGIGRLLVGPLADAAANVKSNISGLSKDSSLGDVHDAVMSSVSGLPNLGTLAKQSTQRGAANQSTADMYGEQAAPVAAMLATEGLRAGVKGALPGQTALANASKAMRRSALGTNEENFANNAQPDAAANATGVAATRGSQFRNIQSAGQTALAEKSALLNSPKVAATPVDVGAPLDQAVQKFESRHVTGYDPTTASVTTNIPTEGTKFIESYRNQVRQLAGGAQPTAPQADALRAWVGDYIKSFDSTTPGSVQRLALDTYHGLQGNLYTAVPELSQANAKIQSLISAEDAAKTKLYGRGQGGGKMYMSPRGLGFSLSVPGATLAKTGAATLLGMMGGPEATAIKTIPREPVGMPTPPPPNPMLDMLMNSRRQQASLLLDYMRQQQTEP